MKRSQVNEKLRCLAQQEKEAIRPDERHRAMTAALAQNAYKAAAPRRNKMRFPAFVLRQVRYTGKPIWIWQIFCFFLSSPPLSDRRQGKPYRSLFPYVPVSEDPGASVRGQGSCRPGAVFPSLTELSDGRWQKWRQQLSAVPA